MLYVPLPDEKGRTCYLETTLKDKKHSLTDIQINQIVQKTEGYSCSDLQLVLAEAAKTHLRHLVYTLGIDINSINERELKPLSYEDVSSALEIIKATASEDDLARSIEFDKKFGQSYL